MSPCLLMCVKFCLEHTFGLFLFNFLFLICFVTLKTKNFLPAQWRYAMERYFAVAFAYLVCEEQNVLWWWLVNWMQRVSPSVNRSFLPASCCCHFLSRFFSYFPLPRSKTKLYSKQLLPFPRYCLPYRGMVVSLSFTSLYLLVPKRGNRLSNSGGISNKKHYQTKSF